MTAVTANQITNAKCPGGLVHGRAAAENLYANTIAFFDASTGYVTGNDNGGANQFAGIVREQVDNSGGSAGDLDVELWTTGVFYLAGTSLTQALVGDPIYAIDNYTIQASATSASRVGMAVEFVSATELGVAISIQDIGS